MAENENGQEKTEEPTGRRLQQAREEGQVPRSRELNTTVVLLAGAGALILLGEHFGQGLAAIVENALTIERSVVFGSQAPVRHLAEALWSAFVLLVPYIVIMVLAALIPPGIIGGWSFSAKAIAPKLSKLDPVKGAKRILSLRGLMELGKSIAKITLVGGAIFLLIKLQFGELMTLGNQDVESALAQSFHIIGWSFLGMSAVMILVSAVDVPFQIWQHKQQLKMTKQEVKEDNKTTEGNPDVKSRIRRVQQEMATSRMMAEVPGADVVVTNPTHFAVALRYDEKNMRAPRVIAKGADLVASQIRSLAREHDVPLFSAPPLARALYYSTELNQEIPAKLYLAVAQVLAYVYQLKASIYGRAAEPDPPSDLDVPDEFLDPGP